MSGSGLDQVPITVAIGPDAPARHAWVAYRAMCAYEDAAGRRFPAEAAGPGAPDQRRRIGFAFLGFDPGKHRVWSDGHLASELLHAEGYPGPTAGTNCEGFDFADLETEPEGERELMERESAPVDAEAD